MKGDPKGRNHGFDIRGDCVVAVTREDRAVLKEFREEGLLWLVNAALLHPRGYALTLYLSDDGKQAATVLTVQKLDEPWTFGPDSVDAFNKFVAAEMRRERRWTRRMGGRLIRRGTRRERSGPARPRPRTRAKAGKSGARSDARNARSGGGS